MNKPIFQRNIIDDRLRLLSLIRTRIFQADTKDDRDIAEHLEIELRELIMKYDIDPDKPVHEQIFWKKKYS